MNLDMNTAWEHFVQSVLQDLHNGARIPEYFGCLIPLLTRDAPPVVLPNSTPFRENQIDTDDDFISIDVVKPKGVQKPKMQQQPNQMPPQQIQVQQQQPSQQTPPPQQIDMNDANQDLYNEVQNQSSFSSRQWNSSPHQKSPQQQKLESEGSYESPQKDTTLQHSSNEQYDQNDDDYSHYAAHFREITDNIYEKYWPPLKTVLPRMNLQSKLMVTFKRSKYNRLKKIMTENKKVSSNKLRFSRRKDDSD